MIGWLYDLGGRRAERGELGELRRRLVSGLEGEILEVGGGTGANLPHYERANRVVVVEPDPGMAKQIPKKLAEASVPVELRSGTAEHLPFPDEAFDAAVVTFVFCSVEDPQTALAEIRRVLKPGATLTVLEHVRGRGRVAHWQDRLTPLHRRLLGNCHLNRETLAAIRAAGFDTSGVETAEIPGSFPLVQSGIYGVAIKTSS
jgi:ubiquinone/menaquinone biosynthesis C-methylase UbiE